MVLAKSSCDWRCTVLSANGDSVQHISSSRLLSNNRNFKIHNTNFASPVVGVRYLLSYVKGKTTAEVVREKEAEESIIVIIIISFLCITSFAHPAFFTGTLSIRIYIIYV
jgi:hypothetical protein